MQTQLTKQQVDQPAKPKSGDNHPFFRGDFSMNLLGSDRSRTNQEQEDDALKNGVPNKLQKTVEDSFGIAYSDVIIKEGSQEPQKLDALAVTTGNEIHISPEVDVDSSLGQEIVSHELIHVAQQMTTTPSPSSIENGMKVAENLNQEIEADTLGKELRAGKKIDKFGKLSLKNLPSEKIYQPYRNILGPITSANTSKDFILNAVRNTANNTAGGWVDWDERVGGAIDLRIQSQTFTRIPIRFTETNNLNVVWRGFIDFKRGDEAYPQGPATQQQTSRGFGGQSQLGVSNTEGRSTTTGGSVGLEAGMENEASGRSAGGSAGLSASTTDSSSTTTSDTTTINGGGSVQGTESWREFQSNLFVTVKLSAEMETFDSWYDYINPWEYGEAIGNAIADFDNTRTEHVGTINFQQRG